MSAITSPALALTRALDRFDRASARALNATRVSDNEDVELTSALMDQRAAITEVKAVRASVRFSDEMWKALLELSKEEREP